MQIVGILEPDASVAALLGAVIEGLGHVAVDLLAVQEPERLAALVLEPADPASRARARALQARRPGLPIVCVSVAGSASVAGLAPLAFLVKPFRLGELEAAIDAAVRGR